MMTTVEFSSTSSHKNCCYS